MAGPLGTRYAKSDDVHIAYQVVGDASRDLVLVHGRVSHVQHWWTDPGFAAFQRRLSESHRLILFDRRGTGLSDWIAEIPTVEQSMDDVRAVMDAAASESAVIMGVSAGGELSALFAATHPARAHALVLYGVYADNDLRHVLPAIRVPTLVIHRADDRGASVAGARYMARLIPGARFVQLRGAGHLPWAGDVDVILHSLERFLAELDERAEAAVATGATGFEVMPVRPKLASAEVTQRQVEILRLLSRGMRNQEIAVRLGLSEHTVHRHVANILMRLGVRSRTAAAARAIREGLI